jgi:hypothetical protein
VITAAQPLAGILAVVLACVGLTAPDSLPAAGESSVGSGAVDPPAGADTAAPAAGASQIVPGSVNRTSLAIRASYYARVYLSYSAAQMRVTATINFTNQSGSSIDRLELNTVAARLGSFRLSSATVDGRAVGASVSDQTLRLPLGGVLPNGATAQAVVAFQSSQRTSLSGFNWMFTRYNGIINAYRWLPWVSRTTAFMRPNHGDPFVTVTSPAVKVKITTDRTMLIASSGHRTEVSGLTQTFVANNVRDFNIAASPFYRTTSGTVGTTRVTVYYRNAPGSTMLSNAKTSLSRLTSLLGTPYPHPTYTVAQSAGGFGMESPAHTWIPPVESWRLPYLIRHETAHQWFYSIVGNDQAREPFADEAMADFVTRYSLGSFRGSNCSGTRLDLSIYAYSSSCYYEIVYIRGANVINQVRARMGDTAFWSAVRAYVRAYANKLSHTKTLLQFLDDHTTRDVQSIYRVYFPSLYPS